jgi:hypothetical protein
VWVRDEKEQLVAQGRVRLLCIDEERALGCAGGSGHF